MSEVATGSFTHTLEEIDAGITQVSNAKGDYPTLAAALGAKQDALEFDEVPTENSTDVMLSGGVYPLMDALGHIVDTECMHKNVLQNLAETTTVGSEVTFTVNADGTITATCIAATTGSRQLNWYVTLPKGTWHFSTEQAQSGGGSAPCHAYLYTSTTIARDYGDMQNFVLAEDTTLRCYISIRSGQAQGTVFTFKPMVCYQSYYAMSTKYVPYTASA